MKNTSRVGMLSPMDRYFQCLVAVGVAFVLAACGTLRSSVVVEPAAGATSMAAGTSAARTSIPGGSYTVLKGDTLYSIAFRNGVDFRDLAQWNQVAEPYTIWPGQRLRLSPDSHSVSAAPGRPVAPATAATPAISSGSVAAAPVFESVAPPAPHATPPVVASTASPGVPASTPPTSSSAPPVAAASAGIVPVAGIPAPTTAPPVAPVAVPPAPSRAVSGLTWRWPAAGAIARRFQGTDAIPGIEISGKSGEAVRAAADGVVVYSGNGLVGYGELIIVKHSDSLLSAYGHNRKRLVKEGQHVSAGQPIAEMGATGASRNGLEFQIRKDGSPVDPLAYLPPR